MSKLSFIPLGGAVDVTKNMYLYELEDSVLIVDCGLGFANETMVGVDLILPDITYLLKLNKKISGMILTHGHEDHIGALPFILPQLPSDFEIFATPFTEGLINEKLKEFGMGKRVKTADFGKEYNFGKFNVTFLRVTHSVPDTSNLFIKTPVGNFYHGSDFKFDDTPYDGQVSDYERIKSLSSQGVICMMTDVLGAEKEGRTPTEQILTQVIEDEMRQTKGKFVFTTYSSNIARQNQVIAAAQKNGRQICFVGRSLVKAADVAKRMKYIQIPQGMEVTDTKDLKRYPDNKIVLVVAGAQGQEGSALSRIVSGEVAEISLTPNDTVMFSSDPIPGNELSVYAVIDAVAKIGARVLYSDIQRVHVSGHGYSEDLMKLVDLVKPRKVLPIGATYRHMAAYKRLVKAKGYQDSDILLLDDGQEVIFENGQSRLGRKIEVSNVFVDQLSGEEVESYVLRDREKLSQDGVVVLIVEVNSASGQMINANIVTRGFLNSETQKLNRGLIAEIRTELSRSKNRVKDWNYLRKSVGNLSERFINKKLKRRPLVLPIVIEV